MGADWITLYESDCTGKSLVASVTRDDITGREEERYMRAVRLDNKQIKQGVPYT